ncbi:MAG: hypothetical protein ACRCZ2_03880 [Fusobacteriaceae bacterium]
MWSDNNYTIKWYEKGGNVLIHSTDTILDKIGSISEKLDPRKSSINTITFDFEVTNQNDQFTKFLYGKLSTKGKMFFREVVEVYKKDKLLYKGFVRSIKVKDSLETRYSIQLENVIGKLKTSLWDREFAEYVSEKVEHINATRLAAGFRMEEKVNSKNEKYRAIFFSGHILDCLKGMFQMVLSKSEIRVNTLFLDNNYQNFIELNNLNAMKNEFDSTIYTVKFEWREPISNLFDFFQEQIFQAVGVIPVINPAGKLEIRIHQQPTVGEGIKLFDETNTIKYNSKSIDESQVVNYLKVDYVKDVEEDSYIKSIVKINSGSFEFFGNELIPAKPQEIKVDCINYHSRADQVAFCSNIADRLFSRYSREINIIDIKVPIQLGYNVGLGEFISIESKQLVDWVDGTREFTEEKDTQTKYVRFDVLDIWGGFIEDNTLGVGQDGSIVVTTTMSDVNLANFRDKSNAGIQSFLENHDKIKRWVDTQ